MSLQPGDTLLNGQYRIERLLGRGGFGFVYLAQDTLLQEEVALKELIPALVGDEGMLKRFLAEAKATMRLTHERIVRTHAVFADRGNYYIAMEYMAGGSLEARLAERGALPVEDAVHVATDVVEGLAYAHGRGVVHCDLKPANVLWELTSSLWGKDWQKPDFGYPYDAEDGRENQTASDAVLRVLRGGSWNFHWRNIRAAVRSRNYPDNRYDYIGFRCARS